MDTNVTFGSRVRALRLDARLSQRELATRLARRLKGFDFTYLSKIENNRLVPSAGAIIALAAELKGNSDELLALAGKAPKEVGEMLQKSEGARIFFRSALTKGLSEEDWKKLLLRIEDKKK